MKRWLPAEKLLESTFSKICQNDFLKAILIEGVVKLHSIGSHTYAARFRKAQCLRGFNSKLKNTSHRPVLNLSCTEYANFR